jgi:hypothetical protein
MLVINANLGMNQAVHFLFLVGMVVICHDCDRPASWQVAELLKGMVLGVAHENGYGNPLLCPKMIYQ